MKNIVFAGFLIALAGAAATTDDALAASMTSAHATLKATEGNNASGMLDLIQTADGVSITGTISGLTPNSHHGFHIHENGDCSSPDAKSAGGHFAPAHHQHGNPANPPHHAGDMPNIDADAKGVAKVELTVKGVTLDKGPQSVLDRAIVVHEKADDYTSQPAGDSGPRIACGVISKS